MAIQKVSREVSLANYICSQLEVPFCWGDNDCVTFVLGWVKLKTGVDHKLSFLPWTNEAEAIVAIAAVGGIEKKCNELFVSVNPMCASDGDIALIGRTVYLFSGPNIVGPGIKGLVFEDRMRTKCAWSYP